MNIDFSIGKFIKRGEKEGYFIYLTIKTPSFS